MKDQNILFFDAIASSAAETRDYELIDGKIVMMTNPTETHEVTELIGRLREERGVAILVIEHDMHVVAGCSDRVVALDHYAWGIDFAARGEYWAECAAKGVLPDHGRDMADFWRPELPGRRGFDFACEALGSKVEAVVADFTTVRDRVYLDYRTAESNRATSQNLRLLRSQASILIAAGQSE